ncbi:YcbK family protein [Shigella flexneri]
MQDELARLNHFFRDFRANKIKSVDPGLLDQLYRLQGLLARANRGNSFPVIILLDTNNRLRCPAAVEVAKKSYHTQGEAIDFHIEGVSLANIRKAGVIYAQVV